MYHHGIGVDLQGSTRGCNKYCGTKEDGITPKALLELKERPIHSNCGACDECEKAKAAWVEV
eukprot:6176658-Pleurochrysis_carterae.AAC.3